MFIIDDMLLAPIKGLAWVFDKVRVAAMEEIDQKEENLRSDLAELNMQLDNGEITEEEFEAREKELLDRLDEIEELRSEEDSGTEDAEEENVN